MPAASGAERAFARRRVVFSQGPGLRSSGFRIENLWAQGFRV